MEEEQSAVIDTISIADIESFRQWLENRRNPSVSQQMLRWFRDLHGVETPSIYTVAHILKVTQDPELTKIGAWTLIIYLHNQYFPPITDEQAKLICDHYARWEDEKIIYCTFEVILHIICEKLGIDCKIKTSECAICREPLGWHETVLSCGHVFHSACLTGVKACAVCRKEI